MTYTPRDECTPAVVVNAPGEIWLTFGDLSEFSGQVEYSDAFRAADVSWCEEQIEVSDVKYIRADLVSQQARGVKQPAPKQIAWLWYTPNTNGTWMPHTSIEKPIVQSGVHMLQPLYTLPEPPIGAAIGKTMGDTA